MERFGTVVSAEVDVGTRHGPTVDDKEHTSIPIRALKVMQDLDQQ